MSHSSTPHTNPETLPQTRKAEPENAVSESVSRVPEQQRTEDELRESQARLSGIVDSAMDAIITVDSKQCIIVFNRAAEKMFHCPASEAIGQRLDRFIPTRFCTSHSSHIQNFGQTGVTTRAMAGARAVYGLRADGDEFPVEASISQVEAGGQKLYTVIMRDITERERAEERFRLVVEAAPSAMLMVGDDGLITLVNNQAEQLFGYPREELLDQPVEMLVPDRYRSHHPSHRDTFSQHPTTRAMGAGRDLFGRRKDGSEVPIEIGLNPIQTNEGSFVLASIVDITERKRAEQSLRESEERLHTVIENLSEGLVISDLNGQLIHWNQAGLEMHGFSSMEECLLKLPEFEKIFELSSPDGSVLELEQWPLPRVIAGECLTDYKVHVRRIDTDWNRVFSYGGAIVNEPNGQALAFVTITDITERKQAEEKILQLNAELEQRVEERTAALHASEARYRLLFDSIDEGFCIIEMIFDEQEKPVDYRFLEVNRSFERQTGLRDAVGKRMRELAPRHEEHWFETYGRIAVTGETARFQDHAKELHHWYDVYACRFGEAKSRQVAIVFGDITGRKVAEANIAQLNAELQQRAAELNSLFESLPGLYLVLTPDLKIVAASDAYLKATMTTRESILGRNLFELFPDNPDDPGTTAVANMQASIDRVIQNAVSDTMAIQKHDVRRPDGVFEERYWSPINSPMFGADRQIKYIIHRVEEVTEFVRQKSQPTGSTVELSARVQQMEAEVFQSSQKLQAANQQLEATNKELEAFSYSVSHDLRAPLRHINGFSQALLEDYADKLDEEGKDYLHQVRDASQEMAQLIDDVLQLARVTRSEMRREVVNLSELAQSIAAELQERDGGRTVAVQIAEGLLTHGDKRLLQIMLSNLLGNAWKFTSKQQQAEIAFGHERKEGPTVYFVRDNGAGFDMAFADKLFGAFQRLHTAAEFEGTGIGLATVQRVVNRHGGRVWGEGMVNQGATFYFTLPDLMGERT